MSNPPSSDPPIDAIVRRKITVKRRVSKPPTILPPAVEASEQELESESEDEQEGEGFEIWASEQELEHGYDVEQGKGWGILEDLILWGEGRGLGWSGEVMVECLAKHSCDCFTTYYASIGHQMCYYCWICTKEGKANKSEYFKERWANMTEEQREAVKAKGRERWPNMPEEEKEAVYAKRRELWANMTEEEKEARKAKDREYSKERYANMPKEQKEAAYAKRRERWANMTEEEKEAAYAKDREYKANRPEEEKEARKAKDSERYDSMTEEQRAAKGIGPRKELCDVCVIRKFNPSFGRGMCSFCFEKSPEGKANAKEKRAANKAAAVKEEEDIAPTNLFAKINLGGEGKSVTLI